VTGGPPTRLERAAVGLAAAAAGVAGAVLAGELTGYGVGPLRVVLVALSALASAGCLAAAGSARGAGRRTLAGLAATLGACAAVTLGREVDAAPWSELLDVAGAGIVGALLLWLLLTQRRG
jgi:hypothetical protein